MILKISFPSLIASSTSSFLSLIFPESKKYFDVKKESLSKTVYLNFDGVYMNSEVWVNGHYLGKRPYGYISFRYDVSSHLKEGKNTIAVRVDNSLEPSARWYHPCGIYAPVKLVEVNKTHIKPNGVFITTPSIQANKASQEDADQMHLLKYVENLQLKIFEEK